VTNDTQPLGHVYQRRIEEMLQAKLFFELPAGGTYRLTVVHDDDCPFFHGGWCNCQPDFELQDMATGAEVG